MSKEKYLYHGTNESAANNIIKNGINLNIGRKNTDFGQVFYLAQNKGTAIPWASRTSRKYGGQPVLMYFTLNTKKLNIKFHKVSVEWAELIVTHRLERVTDNNIDLIVGPIADGNTMDDVIAYDHGEITINELINKLTSHKYGLQFVIKSELAKENLTFIKKEGI